MDKWRMWFFASPSLVGLCKFYRNRILDPSGSSPGLIASIQGQFLPHSLDTTKLSTLLCSSLRSLGEALRCKTPLLLDLGNTKVLFWLKGLPLRLPDMLWAVLHRNRLFGIDLFAVCLKESSLWSWGGTVERLVACPDLNLSVCGPCYVVFSR